MFDIDQKWPWFFWEEIARLPPVLALERRLPPAP